MIPTDKGFLGGAKQVQDLAVVPRCPQRIYPHGVSRPVKPLNRLKVVQRGIKDPLQCDRPPQDVTRPVFNHIREMVVPHPGKPVSSPLFRSHFGMVHNRYVLGPIQFLGYNRKQVI